MRTRRRNIRTKESVCEREKTWEKWARVRYKKKDITSRIIIDYDCKFIESLTRYNVIINGMITHTHTRARAYTYTGGTQYTYTRIHKYTHPEIRVNDNKNNTID